MAAAHINPEQNLAPIISLERVRVELISCTDQSARDALMRKLYREQDLRLQLEPSQLIENGCSIVSRTFALQWWKLQIMLESLEPQPIQYRLPNGQQMFGIYPTPP